MTRTEWEPLRLKRIEEYKAMTIKERRKAFLDDTISHYNSKNRAFNLDIGGCVYGPTKSSCGCAIGRWLPVEVSKSLPQRSVDECVILDSLPEWMVEMGLRFLLEIQSVHDYKYCWNENGPNDLGSERADQIRRRFKLN